MCHLIKGKAHSEREQIPALNGVCPHVVSPHEGRIVSCPIWGMLPFCPICVLFSLPGGKLLNATTRVGKWHISGPRSPVSKASLVAGMLAVAMEIWNHECGSFWPNFAVFAIVCHIGTANPSWSRGNSQEVGAIFVANDRGLNPIQFRICSSGSSGVIELLVRSMIPPFAPHVVFCPIRVSIPSVKSKQPV